MEPCASAKKIKPAYTESVNYCKLISQRGPIFSKAPVQHVGVSMRITAEKKKKPSPIVHANWTQHRPGLTLNLKMVNNHNILAITQLYKVASYHSKTYGQVITHDT